MTLQCDQRQAQFEATVSPSLRTEANAVLGAREPFKARASNREIRRPVDTGDEFAKRDDRDDDGDERSRCPMAYHPDLLSFVSSKGFASLNSLQWRYLVRDPAPPPAAAALGGKVNECIAIRPVTKFTSNASSTATPSRPGTAPAAPYSDTSRPTPPSSPSRPQRSPAPPPPRYTT